jgi:DNA-binding response OmpR family regulator
MKKILIVEDDRNIARSLEVRLKSEGYEVAIAGDAMTGVNSALKFRPDLVLLDISLPAGSGFSVAERLQRLLATMMPFIFLTASKQPGVREKAKELGASGFFEKPYDGEELLAAIRRAFGGTPALCGTD